MRHNKTRVTAHTGDIVDVTDVDENTVVLQLANSTGFVRIMREFDGRLLVKFFNTPKVRVSTYASACSAALSLLRKVAPTIDTSAGDEDLSADPF